MATCFMFTALCWSPTAYACMFFEWAFFDPLLFNPIIIQMHVVGGKVYEPLTQTGGIWKLPTYFFRAGMFSFLVTVCLVLVGTRLRFR